MRPVRVLGRARLGVEARDHGIDLRGLARHGLEHRVRAQRVKVGARQVEGALLRNHAQITDVVVQHKLARERLQDVELCIVRLGHRQVQEAIKAARPQERRVQQVRSIRRADHKHVTRSRA